VLVAAVPQLDVKREVRRDVVEVRVRQLAERFIHAEVGLRGRAPEAFAFGA
jgi:hypothetical protein